MSPTLASPTLTSPTLTASATAASASRSPGGPALADLVVVTTHKVRDRSAGVPMCWLPYGTEHAWRPGMRQSLCGEWTSGWTVFWERAFAAAAPASCPDCVEASLPEESRRRLDPRVPR